LLNKKSSEEKMKKVLKCMGMMALVALAFTSCKKNETPKQTFRFNAPEFSYESLDEERMYIINQNGQMNGYFEQGDVCMLFNINETTPTKSHAALYGATEPGTSEVPFVNIGYGEIGEDMLDGYYAYYPGGVGHMITFLADGENKCKFYVAPEQKYRPGMVAKDALYSAAKGVDDTHLMHGETHFNFLPICGVLALKPYENVATPRSIKKIEVVDNSFCLSGLVELIIPEVDPAEMTYLLQNFNLNNPSYVTRLEAYKNRVGYNVTGETIYNMLTGEYDTYVKGKRMTLKVKDGEQAAVQMGKAKANTPVFYIVLRPLACLYGFQIIFTFDDDTTAVKTFNGNPNQYIKPGIVSSLSVDLAGL
jgi:hypothetical protein